MTHRRGWRRPVPMLLCWREPDDVARPDLLDRAALVLDAAAAGHDDQSLAERVRVPGGARAGLEGDESAGDAGWIWRTEQRVDPDRAGEPLRWSLAGRLRAAPLDLHQPLLLHTSPPRSGSPRGLMACYGEDQRRSCLVALRPQSSIRRSAVKSIPLSSFISVYYMIFLAQQLRH